MELSVPSLMGAPLSSERDPEWLPKAGWATGAEFLNGQVTHDQNVCVYLKSKCVSIPPGRTFKVAFFFCNSGLKCFFREKSSGYTLVNK